MRQNLIVPDAAHTESRRFPPRPLDKVQGGLVSLVLPTTKGEQNVHQGWNDLRGVVSEG